MMTFEETNLQDLLHAAEVHPARDDLAKHVSVAQVLSSAVSPCEQTPLLIDCCRAVVCMCITILLLAGNVKYIMTSLQGKTGLRSLLQISGCYTHKAERLVTIGSFIFPRCPVDATA